MSKDSANLPFSPTGVDPLGTGNLTQRIHLILELTQELTGLIESETALLKKHRPSELRLTEVKKSKLSSLYAREMRAIQARPQLLQGATHEQKQSLHRAAEDFQAIMLTHTRRLVHTRAVTESLVIAIGEELSNRRSPATRYQPPHARKAATHHLNATPAAIAFSHDTSI